MIAEKTAIAIFIMGIGLFFRDSVYPLAHGF